MPFLIPSKPSSYVQGSIRATATGGLISEGDRVLMLDNLVVTNNIYSDAPEKYIEEASGFTNACKISNNRYLFGRSKIGTLQGLIQVATWDSETSTFVFLGEEEFFPAEVYNVSITSMGTNKFAIGYFAQYAGYPDIRFRIGTVNESNEITLGTEFTIYRFTTALVENFRTVMLDENTVCATYKAGSSTEKGYIRLATLNGIELDTLGTAVELHGYSTFYTDISIFDTNKFAVCYKGNNDYIYARLGTWSGTVPTLGTEKTMLEDFVYHPRIAKLNSTTIIMAVGATGDSYKLSTLLCDFSGNEFDATVTKTIIIPDEFTCYKYQILIKPNNKYTIIFRTSQAFGELRAITGIISGTTHYNKSWVNLCDYTSTRYNHSTIIDDDKFLTVLRNNSGNYANYVISNFFFDEDATHVALEDENVNRYIYVLPIEGR